MGCASIIVRAMNFGNNVKSAKGQVIYVKNKRKQRRQQIRTKTTQHHAQHIKKVSKMDLQQGWLRQTLAVVVVAAAAAAAFWKQQNLFMTVEEVVVAVVIKVKAKKVFVMPFSVVIVSVDHVANTHMFLAVAVAAVFKVKENKVVFVNFGTQWSL